jgi:hypothetical protein
MLVEQIHRAIWHLSAEEQLLVLDFAWLVVASIVRTEALTVPGGLPEEMRTDRTTAGDVGSRRRRCTQAADAAR